MYIQGTNQLSSGGAVIVSSEFTVPAGALSVQPVRANVYASETGQLTVTGDIVYWPEGFPDLQRTISGLTLQFNVEEPVERGDASTGSPTATAEPTEADSPGLSLLTALVALAAVLVAARIRRR